MNIKYRKKRSGEVNPISENRSSRVSKMFDFPSWIIKNYVVVWLAHCSVYSGTGNLFQGYEVCKSRSREDGFQEQLKLMEFGADVTEGSNLCICLYMFHLYENAYYT